MVARLSAWLNGPPYNVQVAEVERNADTVLSRATRRDAMGLMQAARQLNPSLTTDTLERVAPCMVGRAEGIFEPRPNRLLLSERAMPHVAFHEIVHSLQHKASSLWNRFCYGVMNWLPRFINRIIFPNTHRAEALYGFASQNLIARHPEFDTVTPATLQAFMAETPTQRRSVTSVLGSERLEFVTPLAQFAERVRALPNKTLPLFVKTCLDEVQAYSINARTAGEFGLNEDHRGFFQHQISAYQGLITMVRVEEQRRQRR